MRNIRLPRVLFVSIVSVVGLLFVSGESLAVQLSKSDETQRPARSRAKKTHHVAAAASESSVDLDDLFGDIIIRTPKHSKQLTKAKPKKAIKATKRAHRKVAKRPEAPRVPYRKHVPAVPTVELGTAVNPGPEAGMVRAAGNVKSPCSAEIDVLAEGEKVKVLVSGKGRCR